MDRFRILSALAVVLAVAAVGTIAGGLSSGGGGNPSSGFGVGSGEGSGIGASDQFGLGVRENDPAELPEWLTLGPILLVVWVSAAAALVATLVFLWTASLREILARLRESLTTVAAIGLGMALFIVLLLLLSQLFSAGGGGLLGESATGSDELVGETTVTDSPSVLSLLVLVAAVVLTGVVLLVLLTDRDDEGGDGGETSLPEDDTAPSVDATVGSTATVDEPDASNEVYRAWITLRDEVGRPDRTESPAELRRRALDAGLDEGAVSELTDLFNATRYGDRPVTNAEERRARRALDALRGRGDDG